MTCEAGVMESTAITNPNVGKNGDPAMHFGRRHRWVVHSRTLSREPEQAPITGAKPRLRISTRSRSGELRLREFGYNDSPLAVILES
jgi:hypothetical protein